MSVCLLISSGAAASDGVIEINQAAVVAGNITPGDAPGFPATLSLQGSYRLTGNLSSPIGTGAIEITATQVTLDLNEFTVSSTNACTGYPTTSCTTTNGAPGILSNQYLVEVRNGHVHSMGGTCVKLLGPSSTVDHVRALACGSHGIEVGGVSRVTRSFSGSNKAWGIFLSFGGGLAEANEARANGADGIFFGNGANQGGQALNNRAFDNGGFGLARNNYASLVLASKNVATNNGAGAISLGASLGDNLCNGVFC
jgi:hypothetical protein